MFWPSDCTHEAAQAARQTTPAWKVSERGESLVSEEGLGDAMGRGREKV